MASRIRIEVTDVNPRTKCCTVGDVHTATIKACPPICPKLFYSAFPAVYSMLTARRGAVPRRTKVVCPDGLVTVEVSPERAVDSSLGRRPGAIRRPGTPDNGTTS